LNIGPLPQQGCGVAFDNVKREETWKSLEKTGIAADLLRKVIYILKRTVNCVKTNKRQSTCSETRSGVRQGSVLSPVLFNIAINDVCNKIKEKMKVTDLQAYIYADDVIMIWGDNVEELEVRLARVERESKSCSLQINLEKTIMLRLSRKEENNIRMKVNGSKIK
jgi:hypothetical protein